MGIPDHFTCLLRNLHAVRKQQLEPCMEQQIEKGVQQSCLLSLCIFNLHAEHIIWNAGLNELQAIIKIAGRDTNNFRYTDTTLMAENEEELKNHLMRLKGESEKAHLDLNIKTKIMASCPITSWQIEGEKVWKQWQISSSWTLKSLWMVTVAMKLEDDCFLAGKLWET